MEFRTAIIYIMENSNSVVVHFGGFDDTNDAYDFSDQLMKDLNIQRLDSIPEKRTLH
tara:strand:- start:338 stop:508 length:171 start_codon:yes stop_codon:yes gene_type:complete